MYSLFLRISDQLRESDFIFIQKLSARLNGKNIGMDARPIHSDVQKKKNDYT